MTVDCTWSLFDFCNYYRQFQTTFFLLIHFIFYIFTIRKNMSRRRRDEQRQSTVTSSYYLDLDEGRISTGR